MCTVCYIYADEAPAGFLVSNRNKLLTTAGNHSWFKVLKTLVAIPGNHHFVNIRISRVTPLVTTRTSML